MQKVLPLSDQVRSALRDPTTSEALKALIESTGFALEATRQERQAAKAKAVDPLSTDKEADDARLAHHDLGFEEERQESSVARLKHRLATVMEEEDEARRRAAYDTLAADKVALAERLRDRYPVLAAEIVGLLKEIQEMNRRVIAVNGQRPSGASWVQPVEHEARGPVDSSFPIPGFGGKAEPYYERPVSLVRAVSLPAFDSMAAKSLDGYLWHGRVQSD